jgi:hypothetical protein
VRAPGAILQGILQAAGPVACYYKVLTGRFVTGSLFLDPRFGSSFWAFCPGRFPLDPRSWSLVLSVRVLGVTLTGSTRRLS